MGYRELLDIHNVPWVDMTNARKSRVFVALTVALTAAGAVMFAQTPPAAPTAPLTFDVASIKPSNPNPTGPLGATPSILPALGRLTAQNVTLRMLVMTAYDKQPFQMVGGPSWQNSNKFDITARTADANAKLDQMRVMLQGLLADRFKLKAHIETREVPIYALIVARDNGRLGPKMKASTDTCPDFKEQQQQMLEALAKGGISSLQ